MDVKVCYQTERGLHWIEAKDVQDVPHAFSLVHAHMSRPDVFEPVYTGGPWLGLIQGGLQ